MTFWLWRAYLFIGMLVFSAAVYECTRRNSTVGWGVAFWLVFLWPVIIVRMVWKSRKALMGWRP